MQKAFLSNYLKTYLWQGVGMVLNLASLFIVIPMITTNQLVYGIYSICISTAIFLNYADLGFVSAGIKYAGESFAKGNHKDEINYYGFSGFILFVLVALIAVIYFLFSLDPSLLIKDAGNVKYLDVASRLLLIQAIFSLNTVLLRYVNGVFQVRIEQYVYQRVNIVSSIIKIVSVFYFFGSGRYDIVGYYLFIKLVELTALIIAIVIINARYRLSFLEYLKAFHFNRKIFGKIKSLAFSSLFVTLMWILYYELDIIAVGKMLGASAAAVFALAFTLMTFLRSLTSVIFSPFQSRYNHLVGLNNIEGLKDFVWKVIRFTMPIFVLFVSSIILLNKNIILTWAGIKYLQSGLILSLLGVNFMYSFIVIPGANIITALVRIKEMYLINFIMVVVFWLGVFLTKNYFGVVSFAGFKLISGTLAMLFYLKFLLGFLNKSWVSFIKQTLVHLIFPFLIEVIFLLMIRGLLPDTKGKLNLLIVIIVGGIGTLIGFISLYYTSGFYKKEFNYYLTRVKNINK